MNSYKIAICDDNKAQIEFLSAAVLHWGEKRDIHPQIFTFENGESFLFQYTEDKSFDILLLDIEMRQLNGVQLAKTIRRENKEVQIIFITGYMDYISDGYDVEALHYLLKPVSEEKLDTDLSTVDTVIKTGNKMADAILNSKISLAKSKNITVIADAHVPMTLTTKELDLCIIIGNLFDNAIEASIALPEKERLIRIYMDMKNTQLYMCFTNMTAGKKLKKENGRFRTTKGEGHGFGLVRIDTIVKRYGGYLSRNSEEGAFTTEILLPQ